MVLYCFEWLKFLIRFQCFESHTIWFCMFRHHPILWFWFFVDNWKIKLYLMAYFSSHLPFECRSFRNSLPQFCHSATFYSAKWHSATRPNGKNIPQKMFGNQLFGKKAFGNIYSENIHSEKNIKKFDNRQLFIPQNEIWKNRLSETSYSEK